MSATISLWPWWIVLPLLAGSCALTLIFGLAVYRAFFIVSRRAWHGALNLIDSMTQLFVNATMAAFGRSAALLKLLVNLLMWPVTILWEHTALRAHNALALKAEAFRQRQELWNHWRREFRDQFPTFREFLDAFEGHSQHREEPGFQDEPRPGADGRDKPHPPPDPQRAEFIAACRLFGLPESGAFTLKDLTMRYRLLISKAHPDRPEHSGRATSINVARDLIKQRKGWT